MQVDIIIENVAYRKWAFFNYFLSKGLMMSGSHITQVKVYDLTKQERELAFGYIVSILLKSRIACGKSDDQKSRDDVDVYIASLGENEPSSTKDGPRGPATRG